jgi:hypothetical protein
MAGGTVLLTISDPSGYARVLRGSEDVTHSTTRLALADIVNKSKSVLKAIVEFAVTAFDVAFANLVKFEIEPVREAVSRERLGNAMILESLPGGHASMNCWSAD